MGYRAVVLVGVVEVEVVAVVEVVASQQMFTFCKQRAP